MIARNHEPLTGLEFVNVVDLGQLNPDALRYLEESGDMCVVTGVHAKPSENEDIKYDIVPSAEMCHFIAQCVREHGDVFHMSAYPAFNMRDAKHKIKRLDCATTDGQHAYEGKQLWRKPKRSST